MPEDAPPDEVLPEYVRALLRPDAYPSPPPDVELRQTHVSYVFLAGDVAYKTKKPVDFGFIDQVEPERREAFCHAEVRLNRRLAPDVYLGVGPIVRYPGGRIAVLPHGSAVPADAEVVEWCVQMRRLRTTARCGSCSPRAQRPPHVTERVVRQLIAFHEAAEVVENDPRLRRRRGRRPLVGARVQRDRGLHRQHMDARGRLGDSRLRRLAA